MDVEPIPIVNRIELPRDPPHYRKRRQNKPRPSKDRGSEITTDEPTDDDHQLNIIA